MVDSLERSLLMKYLYALNEPVLYGRLVDLRSRISEWLAYIPQTFPHYTRHTVGHSDEIVHQLSSLLFIDQDLDRPIIKLSGAEVFCLLAAAYLHDAGMVVSDEEKSNLLATEDWRQWTTEGPGRTRWELISQLRSAADPTNIRDHFVLDLQIRYLIAEYIRRQHHTRSGAFLAQTPVLLGHGDDQDPALLRTVADICVAHGLDWLDLGEIERYPLRRDLQGGSANVRLLAILLRLGDLLDLSNDRACPLIQTAGSPVPSDSLAHWSQYKAIIHRVTAPDRIELIAECHTQDEHRILRDWCQWIEEEATHATVLLRGSPRHESWRPPAARLSGTEPTIIIRPSSRANYIPKDWTFHLDKEAVLERLITDVYDSPYSFIRELLQNAADAHRCTLAVKAQQRGIDYQGWPDGLEDLCADMPITVTLGRITIRSPLSDELEKRSVLSVEDSGVGMDADIIERYLLQVGRSFYTSNEFRRQYGFLPIGRFGVGFLSVFAVSDRIELETYKAVPGAQPLRLVLSGPKSYILLERGSRVESGTRVSVQLQQDLEWERIVRIVSYWCRRLEFPVVVKSELEPDSRVTEIVHELPADLEESYDLGLPSYPAFRFRSEPINTPTIRGELYITEVQDTNERWRWDIPMESVRQEFKAQRPLSDELPSAPGSSLCIHGMSIESHSGSNLGLRIDVRKPTTDIRVPLGRNNIRIEFPLRDSDLDAAILGILLQHLDSTPSDWKYRQNIIRTMGIPDRIALDLPESIRVFRQSNEFFISPRELVSAESIVLAVGLPEGGVEDSRLNIVLADLADGTYVVSASDVAQWSDPARSNILGRKWRLSRVDSPGEGIYRGYLEPDADWVQSIELLVGVPESISDEIILVRFPKDRLYSNVGFYSLNIRNPVYRYVSHLAGEDLPVGETRDFDYTTLHRSSSLKRTLLGRLLSTLIDSYSLSSIARDPFGSFQRALVQLSSEKEVSARDIRLQWKGAILLGSISE